MSPAPSRESSVINETEGAEGSPQAQKEEWEERWGQPCPGPAPVSTSLLSPSKDKGSPWPSALLPGALAPHYSKQLPSAPTSQRG